MTNDILPAPGPAMRIAKWGNSLAVRLPRKLVEELCLTAGEELEIVRADGRRIAVRRDPRRERALGALAALGVKLPEGYRFDRGEANDR